MQYLIIATAYVSIYTLVFMSLDRFLAVVYPIESMTLRTESNCRKAIIATWEEEDGIPFFVPFASQSRFLDLNYKTSLY